MSENNKTTIEDWVCFFALLISGALFGFLLNEMLWQNKPVGDITLHNEYINRLEEYILNGCKEAKNDR